MDHKDRTHAMLSPSGAHRWLNCTPSALIEAREPDTTSEAAMEGTVAHELAEAKVLNYYKSAEFSKRKLNARIKKLKEHELWQDEMMDYTDDYLDYVKTQAMKYGKEPFIAVEKRVDLTKYIPNSFGTADMVLVGDDQIQVIDLKYGKGVQVFAEKNPQMMLYALGAYEAFKILYNFKTVKMCIAQPRLNHFDEWECTVEELLEFGAVVKDKAQLAYRGEGPFNPGDWCRFCRARKKCRARAEANVQLAFATDKKPPYITNEEIGEYLKKGEDVAKWLSDLQDYALSECLKGNEVAGYKAVEGRGSRDWVDMDKAFEIIIADGTEEAMLWERKPLTLAKTEKLVGKKHFNELVGDLVIKKPGKPTLVPASDKREAITNQLTAEEVFKQEEK